VRSAEEIGAAVARVVAGEPRARLEYAVLCDPVSLEPAERVDAATQIAVAVWLDGVRLIDNVLLDPSETSPARLARHEVHTPAEDYEAVPVEFLLAELDRR